MIDYILDDEMKLVGSFNYLYHIWICNRVVSTRDGAATIDMLIATRKIVLLQQSNILPFLSGN